MKEKQIGNILNVLQLGTEQITVCPNKRIQHSQLKNEINLYELLWKGILKKKCRDYRYYDPL